MFSNSFRTWFEKFCIIIASLEFYSSDCESGLFLNTTSHDHIILSLYFDDMIDWIRVKIVVKKIV